MTSITRNRSAGTLLLNGATATLRGGNYSLFLLPGAADKAVEKKDTDQAITFVYNGIDPCQSGTNRAIPAEFAPWAEQGNTFGEFFSAMTANRCNFVRLFLTGGSFGTRTLFPFHATTVDGQIKFDVRGAVLEGRWNEAFFTRLRAFVAAADAAGVVVQLSLFNYFDLQNDSGALKSWTETPWRAMNSLHPAWASTHLMPEIAAREDRQRFFITPGNGLRAVQQELIGKTVKSLAGLGNVILEVMNEPHDTLDINKLVEFDSYMTGLIVQYRRTHGSQALISINASYQKGQQGATSDVDVWRTSGRPHFGEVDLVSYHGLTGYPNKGGYKACPYPCPTGTCLQDASAPRVDQQAIVDRANQHFGAHPDKPMMYSTDAVRVEPFEHFWNNHAVFMKVRDGQILVQPEAQPQDPMRSELLRTRVLHWASKCLQQARQRPGRVHFHNHSTFRESLVQIGQASSTFAIAGVAEAEPAAT
ncbi:MAG TPA: hypothetical protein VFS20_05030 [Longimicrobium sp.]|nr:hypothetical protein [Longimicrobium sp.]